MLGTRRCAPRTLRAWCRAAQPLDAIAASRYALGADGMDALRARAPACVPPPITRALPLSGEDVEDVVGFALLESPVQGALRALAEGEGVGRGVSDIIMHERAGERLHATAACAVRVGAARHCNWSALSPGQADPPHFERVQRAVPPHDRRHDDRHDDRETLATSDKPPGLFPKGS